MTKKNPGIAWIFYTTLANAYAGRCAGQGVDDIKPRTTNRSRRCWWRSGS